MSWMEPWYCLPHDFLCHHCKIMWICMWASYNHQIIFSHFFQVSEDLFIISLFEVTWKTPIYPKLHLMNFKTVPNYSLIQSYSFIQKSGHSRALSYFRFSRNELWKIFSKETLVRNIFGGLLYEKRFHWFFTVCKEFFKSKKIVLVECSFLK